MATTKRGQTIKMTTTGVVKKGRIKVMAIELVPNAAGDTATFGTYFSGDKDSSVRGAVITSVASGVVTSTGNFTSTNIDTGDVVEIVYASDKNSNVSFLATRDNDNQITASPIEDLTDETTSVWDFDVYTPSQELIVTCDATTGADTPQTTYLNGRWFNNLTLTALSTSAVVYIYFE
jgi:hypothetical protein